MSYFGQIVPPMTKILQFMDLQGGAKSFHSMASVPSNTIKHNQATK